MPMKKYKNSLNEPVLQRLYLAHSWKKIFIFLMVR
jgi:hypothetical protein